jgi:hypothetical protein
MEDQGPKCQILHRQIRDQDFKVFDYFKCKVDSGEPKHSVSKSQECNVDVCGIGLRMERNLAALHPCRSVSLCITNCHSPAIICDTLVVMKSCLMSIQ